MTLLLWFLRHRSLVHFRHGEVFAAPVFHQVHHVPLAGGENPENLVEIPVVPEQVIPLRVVAFSSSC